MLLAVVMGLLVVLSVGAFVVPLRIAGRSAVATRGGGARVVPAGTSFIGLEHLAVGVELQFDAQRWFVRGVQHVAPADGPGWSAWHLDDRGQGGWLVTTDGEDEVLVAVRAEHPETLDPTASSLTWRNHEWVRAHRDGGPAEVEGERCGARHAGLGPVSPADVERVVFQRPELPSRRLVLERSVDADVWNAWIGTAVPGRMVDVWPPAGSLAAETPST
jgi:hypothetical protein